MLSLLEVLNRSTAYFEKAGIENPRLNAEWLIAHALGCKRLDLYLRFDKPLGEEELTAIRPLVKRRQTREPLQHILGSVPFHGVELRCDRRALIPRPETEELIEIVTGLFDQGSMEPPAQVLDLGTGTGAIALSLAKAWENAHVTAVDASDDALELAKENATLNKLADRVTFQKSDWFSNVKGTFDLIVSNPPYLTTKEWEEAQSEVKDYDPYQALVAENDGIADLEHILKAAPAFLNAGAPLVMETGIAQHDRLSQIATTCAYASTKSINDLTGRQRFFIAQKA